MAPREHLACAVRAAEFVRDRLALPTEGGPSGGASGSCAAPPRLRRSYCVGPSEVGAFAEDYAYMIQGLLDLYESAGDVQWLKWALALQVWIRGCSSVMGMFVSNVAVIPPGESPAVRTPMSPHPDPGAQNP